MTKWALTNVQSAGPSLGMHTSMRRYVNMYVLETRVEETKC